eukprot:Blabericola_migrator_1__5939@NODE_2_length_32877_cov_165_790003_g1_i0_p8_GENE_NODE_2_length_32877_cov_165_790003_g1_i0NODE_2_length_32877_cov_165_790003_g1_i0_p8_ORF_typecomplete_len605_score47_78_NODE_2_length_32877_cov_165_790003_g1_i067368550
MPQNHVRMDTPFSPCFPEVQWPSEKHPNQVWSRSQKAFFIIFAMLGSFVALNFIYFEFFWLAVVTAVVYVSNAGFLLQHLRMAQERLTHLAIRRHMILGYICVFELLLLFAMQLAILLPLFNHFLGLPGYEMMPIYITPLIAQQISGPSGEERALAPEDRSGSPYVNGYAAAVVRFTAPFLALETAFTLAVLASLCTLLLKLFKLSKRFKCVHDYSGNLSTVSNPTEHRIEISDAAAAAGASSTSVRSSAQREAARSVMSPSGSSVQNAAPPSPTPPTSYAYDSASQHDDPTPQGLKNRITPQSFADEPIASDYPSPCHIAHTQPSPCYASSHRTSPMQTSPEQLSPSLPFAGEISPDHFPEGVPLEPGSVHILPPLSIASPHPDNLPPSPPGANTQSSTSEPSRPVDFGLQSPGCALTHGHSIVLRDEYAAPFPISHPPILGYPTPSDAFDPQEIRSAAPACGGLNQSSDKDGSSNDVSSSNKSIDSTLVIEPLEEDQDGTRQDDRDAKSPFSQVSLEPSARINDEQSTPEQISVQQCGGHHLQLKGYEVSQIPQTKSGSKSRRHKGKDPVPPLYPARTTTLQSLTNESSSQKSENKAGGQTD